MLSWPPPTSCYAFPFHFGLPYRKGLPFRRMDITGSQDVFLHSFDTCHRIHPGSPTDFVRLFIHQWTVPSIDDDILGNSRIDSPRNNRRLYADGALGFYCSLPLRPVSLFPPLSRFSEVCQHLLRRGQLPNLACARTTRVHSQFPGPDFHRLE